MNLIFFFHLEILQLFRKWIFCFVLVNKSSPFLLQDLEKATLMEQDYQKTYMKPRTNAFHANIVVITRCEKERGI
jgi:hypothetical protein